MTMTQKKLVEGEIREDAILSCHARWWDGTVIHACPEKSLPGKRRCEAHAPDRSRLNRNGVPIAIVVQ